MACYCSVGCQSCTDIEVLRAQLRIMEEQVMDLLPWAEMGAMDWDANYPYTDDFTETGSRMLARIEAGEFEDTK
jgi:hypothetical protein